MKKAILCGLAALVSASGAASCSDSGQKLPNNVNNIPDIPASTATALPPKPDLILKLDGLRSFEDPTLIVNNVLHYSFVRRDGRYQLQRIEPNQKTELVLSLSDPSHNQRVTMDLGDYGRIYTLFYDPKLDDYQISPK